MKYLALIISLIFSQTLFSQVMNFDMELAPGEESGWFLRSDQFGMRDWYHPDSLIEFVDRGDWYLKTAVKSNDTLYFDIFDRKVDTFVNQLFVVVEGGSQGYYNAGCLLYTYLDAEASGSMDALPYFGDFNAATKVQFNQTDATGRSAALWNNNLLNNKGTIYVYQENGVGSYAYDITGSIFDAGAYKLDVTPLYGFDDSWIVDEQYWVCYDIDTLGGGGLDKDLYLKEITKSNDTTYFRVFDRISNTLDSELFSVDPVHPVQIDWYVQDISRVQDSIKFNLYDRVANSLVANYAVHSSDYFVDNAVMVGDLARFEVIDIYSNTGFFVDLDLSQYIQDDYYIHRAFNTVDSTCFEVINRITSLPIDTICIKANIEAANIYNTSDALDSFRNVDFDTFSLTFDVNGDDFLVTKKTPITGVNPEPTRFIDIYWDNDVTEGLWGAGGIQFNAMRGNNYRKGFIGLDGNSVDTTDTWLTLRSLNMGGGVRLEDDAGYYRFTNLVQNNLTNILSVNPSTGQIYYTNIDSLVVDGEPCPVSLAKPTDPTIDYNITTGKTVEFGNVLLDNGVTIADTIITSNDNGLLIVSFSGTTNYSAIRLAVSARVVKNDTIELPGLQQNNEQGVSNASVFVKAIDINASPGDEYKVILSKIGLDGTVTLDTMYSYVFAEFHCSGGSGGISNDWHLNAIYEDGVNTCFELIDRTTALPVDTICHEFDGGGVNVFNSDGVITDTVRIVDLDANYINFRNGSVVFSGNQGITPINGSGTRLMWIPAKAAFRAGTVVSNQWEDANIGSHSAAFGLDNTSSGIRAMTWGGGNTASGSRSTAWGSGSIASGSRSTAWGRNNTASGSFSTAWGSGSEASGNYSTAWGGSEAFSSHETAFGVNPTNYTPNSASFLDSLDRILSVGVGFGTSHRDALIIRKDGYMSLGTRDNTAPWQIDHPIHHSNGAHLTITGEWVNASDSTLKSNIVDLTGGLTKINALRPVTYDHRVTKTDSSGVDQLNYTLSRVGLLAQEVKAVIPEAVSKAGDIEGVNYAAIIPLLIKAIQEQDARINDLEARIEALEGP